MPAAILRLAVEVLLLGLAVGSTERAMRDDVGIEFLRLRGVNMRDPSVSTITTADEGRAIGAIVLAFDADPLARWCWPDSHQYLTSMPPFARAFGGGAFLHQTAHSTDDLACAALWLPPNAHMDDAAVGEILERTTAAAIRSDLFAVFGQMAKYHPGEPHWYLPMIGVDPAYQGRGYGSALLKYALRQCDRDHAPAYLESSNPRNIPLYQRHGFETLGTIQVGTSPTLVPMLRSPRRV